MKKSIISYPTCVKEAFISVTCLEEIASKMVSHLDLVILCFLSNECCFLCFKINKIVCLCPQKKKKKKRRKDNCKWYSFWWKQRNGGFSWYIIWLYQETLSSNIYLINQLFLKASMYSSKIFVFSFVLWKYI